MTTLQVTDGQLSFWAPLCGERRVLDLHCPSLQLHPPERQIS